MLSTIAERIPALSMKFHTGRLRQQCICLAGLQRCSCTSNFEFDLLARWLGLVMLLGLFWALSLVITVSELTASSIVSLWFFSEQRSGKRRKLFFFVGPLWDAYRRNVWTHLGSLAALAALRPLSIFVIPLLEFVQKYRESLPLSSSLSLSGDTGATEYWMDHAIYIYIYMYIYICMCVCVYVCVCVCVYQLR